MSASNDIVFTRDLTSLFNPRSVGVIGASDDPAKWGNMIAKHLITAGHSRNVYLVNRRGGKVLGHDVLEKISDAPEPVDLVCITVPARGLLEAIDDSLAAGAKAFRS